MGPRGHQHQGRGQQVLRVKKRGQADPLVQRPQVLEYGEGEVAGRAGGPGNTRYSCTSSSSAAAVSSHSAASLARHSALGWLASTAQYGRNFRNISSSDISTLFREHLRY